MRRAVGIRREDFEHRIGRFLQFLGVRDETAPQKQLGGVVQVARHVFVARLHAFFAYYFYVSETRVHFQVYVSHFSGAVELCSLCSHLQHSAVCSVTWSRHNSM